MTDASSVPVFPDDVDVAVVSHNGRATLPRLLECLRAAAAPVDRIAVYDIGSTDGTAGWMAAEWPGVTLRGIEGNVGPNPARNRALRETTRPVPAAAGCGCVPPSRCACPAAGEPGSLGAGGYGGTRRRPG